MNRHLERNDPVTNVSPILINDEDRKPCSEVLRPEEASLTPLPDRRPAPRCDQTHRELYQNRFPAES